MVYTKTVKTDRSKDSYQIDRQRDRQVCRKTGRETDRYTERQKVILRDSERETGIQ